MKNRFKLYFVMLLCGYLFLSFVGMNEKLFGSQYIPIYSFDLLDIEAKQIDHYQFQKMFPDLEFTKELSKVICVSIRTPFCNTAQNFSYNTANLNFSQRYAYVPISWLLDNALSVQTFCEPSCMQDTLIAQNQNGFYFSDRPLLLMCNNDEKVQMRCKFIEFCEKKYFDLNTKYKDKKRKLFDLLNKCDSQDTELRNTIETKDLLAFASKSMFFIILGLAGFIVFFIV